MVYLPELNLDRNTGVLSPEQEASRGRLQAEALMLSPDLRRADASDTRALAPKSIVSCWHRAFGLDFDPGLTPTLVSAVTDSSRVARRILPPQHTSERGDGQLKLPGEKVSEGQLEQSGISSAFSGLNQAISRAAAGGRPVSILQYGDSHIAAGIEPESLGQMFGQKFPVKFTTQAKVGITAFYPMADSRKQAWLDQPIQNAQPDLVILSFGSNESAGMVDKDKYRKNLEQFVREVHQRAPSASIMIAGPTDGDCIDAKRRGQPLPHLQEVIEVQRQVAAEYGLDFYDQRAAMGGPGSINQWRSGGLAGPDKLHFTRKGYQALSRLMFDHVMDQAGRK